MNNINYNPDVLSCLANLSNDEVFTSPKLANEVLDMLPKDLWSSPNSTFLDPVCKTGVFLREIAKRLSEGLKNQIPDEQTRINHIFSKQIFGIAITELTSLLSRRSVYCSKYANGKYSVCTEFKNESGNIVHHIKHHTWKGGRCEFCGASEAVYSRSKDSETYAYEFIHTVKPEEIFNMKFDVIIGNPPYQLTTHGAQAQAIPLYNKFVEQAKKLNPRYLSMIIPSRWFSGGFGLDSFRDSMLHDDRIRIIHDYINSKDCFPGVDVKGGICYFLWDRDHRGLCSVTTHDGEEVLTTERGLLEKDSDIFIRYNKAIPILEKIQSHNEKSFKVKISSQRPYGLPTNFDDYVDYGDAESIKVYANKKVGYLTKDYIISKNDESISKWKVLAPKAIGSGESKVDWVKPILAEPNSICTETYVVLRVCKSKNESENVISYIQTKFFHFLLALRKNTQDALAKVYSFIPDQDFSKPWTDAELYAKYNLSKEEIAFIESMVRPEVGGSNE